MATAADAEAKEGQDRLIMVAVDGGEESMYALSWSLKNIISRNSSSKDTLILLHSKPPRAVYTALDGTGRWTGYLFSSDVITSMERYSQDLADSVMEKAKKACSDFEEVVNIETMVDHGDPRDVICEAAEKIKPHLLILGSHGYGLFKRALLGSVSSHCAQNVKCPVLIVKKPKD